MLQTNYCSDRLFSKGLPARATAVRSSFINRLNSCSIDDRSRVNFIMYSSLIRSRSVWNRSTKWRMLFVRLFSGFTSVSIWIDRSGESRVARRGRDETRSGCCSLTGQRGMIDRGGDVQPHSVILFGERNDKAVSTNCRGERHSLGRRWRGRMVEHSAQR